MADKLTRRQAILIILLFDFGSSVVMGVNTGVEQDSWLALLAGLVFAIPVMLMFARIIQLNPNADLFTALESRLGKIFGKISVALMTWYALHLCALVLRNFSEFIQISTLVTTPQLPVMMLMMVAVVYLTKVGVKAMGMWAIAVAPIVLLIVGLTVLLSINVMDPSNLLPFMEHSPLQIASDGFQIFSFPFAETVLFLAIANHIAPSDSARRIILSATILSCGVLLVVILRNLLVLGASVVSIEYFPSYVAARIISLGDFLSRIEGSISVNFILAGITKIAVCLTAASRGAAKLFNLPDDRRLLAPCALAAIALSALLYDNTMQMFGFIKYYSIYALPFEILIPTALWITSEIRARRSVNI